MAFEIPQLIRSWPTASTSFIQYRVVTLTSAGAVKHTTGLSTGATQTIPYGVSQEAPIASTSSTGRLVAVMVSGITKVEASSRAIKIGDFLRATSGAVASTSRLGGTVRPTTAVARPALGIAESACAAGTGRRLVSMRLLGPNHG